MFFVEEKMDIAAVSHELKIFSRENKYYFSLGISEEKKYNKKR